MSDPRPLGKLLTMSEEQFIDARYGDEAETRWLVDAFTREVQAQRARVAQLEAERDELAGRIANALL